MRDALAALPFAHARWVADAGELDLGDIRSLQGERHLPAIGVHLHVVRGASARALSDAIESVARQSHEAQCLLVTREDCETRMLDLRDGAVHVLKGRFATAAEGTQAAIDVAVERNLDLLVPLPSNARLPRHALASYVSHFVRRRDASQSPVLIYGDEQCTDGGEVWFKPEWDPRMIWSQDYVSRACAFAVASYPPGAASLYAAILELLRRDSGLVVEHVPRITIETPPRSWCARGDVQRTTVETAAPHGARVAEGPFGTVHLQFPRPVPLPKVSIIVPTRDQISLLRTCVEGVLEGTNYPDIELIIADNDSRDTETLRFFEATLHDPRVRLVRWPHPFNYSAINNFAAGFATGEYLCLLNNDIEVISPDWLDALVREAAQPGVGAVGARLLYPDLSIQHAGVAIGIGNAAGHAHRGLPDGEPGYFAQALITRGATAVTGACLLVSKRHFDAVGGLDDEALAVAYNDIDLCLKLRELGLSNIYTPAATLIHHESKSRGLDFAPEHLERYMSELAVFQARWKSERAIDPWHHLRLDRDDEKFGM